MKRTPRTSIASPRCPEKSSRRWARWRSWSPTRAARRLAARSTTLSIEWEAVYRSLVLGPRVLIQAVVPGMRERGWGRIVNVGSNSTREPIPGLALSNSHRMATVGLFKTLSREVAAEGITVNTVATGQIRTDRLTELLGSEEQVEERARSEVPAGRLGTPEEYGDLVAFLCSERAGYLTGAVIPLDGGLLRSV